MNPPQESNVFERHPRIAAAAFMTLVAGTLDLGAGTAYGLVAGHSFFERPAVQAIESFAAEQREYRRSSPDYDHDLMPMMAMDGVSWGTLRYDIRTNSLAFKDRRAREVPLQADRHRLLFIGDSFTEGVGYDYERTFVGIVDSALALRDIEVLNAGVSSYSPLLYWRKLAYWIGEQGLEVDEVAVYVDISDAGNEAEVYDLGADGTITHDWGDEASELTRYPSPGRLGRLKDFLKHHTVVLATLVQLKAGMEAEPAHSIPLNLYASRWTTDDSAYEAYGREGERRMTAYMDSLHALLSARGIALTVGVYPWPDQVMAHDLESRHVRLWRNWAATRGARFVNHFPDFLTGTTEQERTAVIVEHFIHGDFHWNAAGHRLMARRFLEEFAPAVDVNTPR